MDSNIKELITLIKREASIRASLIVAIDGRCASGKTTLGFKLAKELNANLIHMDDFFLRPEQRTEERLAIPGENIDHERFLLEVLLPLKESRVFSYRPFSCDRQALLEPIPVFPASVTIIEGSYACHPNLRHIYDFRIFMTVDPEEQLRRIRKRNGDYAEVYLARWIPLEEAYFKYCNVLDCCHTILDTNELGELTKNREKYCNKY